MKKNKNMGKSDNELNKEQRTVEIKKDGIWKSSFKLVGAVLFVYIMVVTFMVIMPYVVTTIGAAMGINSNSVTVSDAVVWLVVGLGVAFYCVFIMLYVTKYMWKIMVKSFKNMVSKLLKKG